VTLLGTLRCGVPGEFIGCEAGCASKCPFGGHCCVTNTAVKREFSAGGVLVRRLKGEWVLAAIRPAGKKPGLWALPKGNIASGEDPRETALREVHEETGAHGRLVEKLGDVRYTYTWAGERIFKIVSFFLLRYASGRLGDLPSETAHEVDEVRWLPLDEAPRLLAYGGERQMAEKALAFVRNGAV
jgi:8-oxo-dGTP pyrophosphatase MutT (NUDIX family)